jgi:hypothetical protein
MVALLCAPACNYAIESPTPDLERLDPALVCTEQLTTTVTVHGAQLSPMPIDTLTDAPGLWLPDLVLDKSIELYGDPPAEAATTNIDEDEAGRVRWFSQARMEFDVSPDLAMVPGGYDVSVRNADDQTAILPEGFVAVPPPRLDSIRVQGFDPTLPGAIICSEQYDNVLTLSGEYFLIVEGTLPTVTFSAVAGTLVRGADSADDCTTLPGPTEAQICKVLTVTVPAMGLDPDVYDVVVTNPDPAGCVSTEPIQMEVVPPPVLESIDPEIVCVEQYDNVFTLTGTGFLELYGVLPQVTIGSYTALADAINGCENLTGPTGGRSCTELTFTLPANSIGVGIHQVVVQNPETAECVSQEVVEIEVVPPPSLSTVMPDLVCVQQYDNTLTLDGTGFLQLGADVPTVTIGSYTAAAPNLSGCTALQGPAGGQTCTRITFDLPMGAIADGVHAVTVMNPPPAQCVSTELVEIESVPPPSVSSLSPPQICFDAPDTVISVQGSGFLNLGGLLPTVNIGGTDHTPIAASSCTPLAGPAGGSTCTSMDILIPAGTFSSPGNESVVVTNPNPAQCSSTELVDLLVVDPPTITGINPPIVCSTGGSFDLFGTGFTPGATVLVGSVPAISVVVDPTGTVLTATMPPALPAGFQDVTVINPDGCDVVAPGLVEVVLGPVLFFVDPPVVYSGITIEASLYVAGVTGNIVDVWMVEDLTGTTTVLDFTYDPAEPNVIFAEIPAGLPEGDYTVFIQDDTGCTPFLDNAVFVEGDLTIAIASIQPPFAWTAGDTPVDVRATDPAPVGFTQFQSIPRVYLNPTTPGPNTVATILRSVTFQDTTLLNAVVPAGLTPDVYDLIVINPDGTIGLLSQALTVTDINSPPPFISSVSPGRVDTGGGAVTVQGLDFRNPTVEVTCGFAGVVTTTPLTPTGSNSTTVGINMPGGTEGTVCVVRVINSDGTYYDYAAVSIGSPSGNLFGFSPGSDMVVGRRAPAAEAGRATLTARYLYAIGGDAGNSPSAYNSIEVAPVDFFGNLSNWRVLPITLPAPRTLASSTRIGRFIYLVGGNDGTNVVDTVLRAQILDPLAAPRFNTLTIDYGGGSGLQGGVWIYRIAALFGAGDLRNPSGESLASDPIVVRVPDVPDRIHLGISWEPVANAVGYRIYRSPAVDAGSGAERWLTDVGNTTDYLDDNSLATTPAVQPLPNGALGEWATVATLPRPLESPCVTAGADPSDPDISYIYVAGGLDDNAAVRDEIYYLTVTEQDPLTQTVSGFTTSTNTLGVARYRCAGYTVDSSLHSVVTTLGEAWIYFGAGSDGNNTDGATDGGRITVGGELAAFQGVNNITPGRSGYGSAAASNYLYIFGGGRGNAPTTPNASGSEAEIVGPLPAIANWNSLAGSGIVTPRVLMGSAQESAVIFVIGGTTDTQGASSSTEFTNF